MNEIKIELNEEETKLFKKWKTYSFLSVAFIIPYFAILLVNFTEVLTNNKVFFFLVLWIAISLFFSFFSYKNKKEFFNLMKENHLPKRHKMLEVMERIKKEKEERNKE